MSHYGTLQSFRFSEKDADDIRGSHLYGINDEKLGKIDDVIFDHVTGDIHYVVVDTGGWLSSEKFIVPSASLRSSAKHENDYEAGLTKAQIETFPPYNEKDVKSDKNWADYQNRYRSNWETGPVMHRAGTDRNITPTTSQMTSGTGATGRPLAGTGPVSAADSEAAASTGSRVVPAAGNSVTIANSASGIGGHWDTFQSQLRARRKEAAVGCTTCTSGPASERGVESAETQRKAV